LLGNYFGITDDKALKYGELTSGRGKVRETVSRLVHTILRGEKCIGYNNRNLLYLAI